jgi:septal ring factor EnvC (AmiA/AmiB activator)
MINHLNKRYEDEKKIFKKLEYDEANLKNNIKEVDTQISTTNKFLEEKKKENE